MGWKEEFKQRREAAGISQRAFARMIGCSHRHIWNLEHGKSAPSNAIKYRINCALEGRKPRKYNKGVIPFESDEQERELDRIWREKWM